MRWASATQSCHSPELAYDCRVIHPCSVKKVSAFVVVRANADLSMAAATRYSWTRRGQVYDPKRPWEFQSVRPWEVLARLMRSPTLTRNLGHGSFEETCKTVNTPASGPGGARRAMLSLAQANKVTLPERGRA